jgi:hypothetical protein
LRREERGERREERKIKKTPTSIVKKPIFVSIYWT